MIWVAILDMLTLVLNLLTLPNALATQMLLPGALIPPAAAGVVLFWRRPLSMWLLSVSLLGGVFLILLSIALMGASAGGDYYERYLYIMLLVAITAIIIFSVPLWCSIAIAGVALAIYLTFQLRNPHLETGGALAVTLFFASGVFAVVAARRAMTILAQKSFLLELRDRHRVEELARANEQLARLVRTDPLTGVANRRWIAETLTSLYDRRAQPAEGIAMLMCDIDDFKKLNDQLGHAEGDRCLVQVARIIQDNIRREGDHVARYGGEEFLVLLPGTGEQGAETVAQRICEAVVQAAIPNPASRVQPIVTLSIGVAAQATIGNQSKSEQLQRRADAALYAAKRSGRNRVACFSPDTMAFGSRPAQPVSRPNRQTLQQWGSSERVLQTV